MAKVVLLNVWHDDNAGDSAIAQTCITAARTRWPNASIEVRTMLGANDLAFASWSRHLQVQFPHVSFLPAYYPEPLSEGKLRAFSVVAYAFRAVGVGLGIGRQRTRKNLSDTEAVILVGGSDLFDVRRRLTNRFRLRRITAAAIDAISLGIPVHLWGHTLGPFETRTGIKIMKPLLEAAESVLVRDRESMSTATDIAPKARVSLVPDLGFCVIPSQVRNAAVIDSWERFVAIVPRRHFFDDGGSRTNRLLAELAEFSRTLLRTGEVDSVVLVSQVVGPSRVEDDRIVVSQLSRLINDPRVHILDGGQLSPSEFAGVYSRARAVVAVRLHGAILAMAGATPALAISYFTGKTAGVMEGLGFEDSWVDFDKCQAAGLVEWWKNVACSSGRKHEIEEKLSLTRREVFERLSSS